MKPLRMLLDGLLLGLLLVPGEGWAAAQGPSASAALIQADWQPAGFGGAGNFDGIFFDFRHFKDSRIITC